MMPKNGLAISGHFNKEIIYGNNNDAKKWPSYIRALQ
jgi:hypothetical protein